MSFPIAVGHSHASKQGTALRQCSRPPRCFGLGKTPLSEIEIRKMSCLKPSLEGLSPWPGPGQGESYQRASMYPPISRESIQPPPPPSLSLLEMCQNCYCFFSSQRAKLVWKAQMSLFTPNFIWLHGHVLEQWAGLLCLLWCLLSQLALGKATCGWGQFTLPRGV